MKAMNLLTLATLLAALGSGLIAGLFFAFSTSVMKALGSSHRGYRSDSVNE